MTEETQTNEAQETEQQQQTPAPAGTKPAAYENMKVFKTVYKRPADGVTEIGWHASKAAAEARMAELQASGSPSALDAESIQEVQIPIGKKKLLVWLNENFTS